MSLRPYGERWLDVEGVCTRYFETGAGPSVLLLHGGTIGDDSACNAEEWDRNVAAIAAAGYRVIAIDKLGQGYTDNPQREEDYSMRGQVRHAAGFMHRLGAAPYHVIGHSRGGYVACRLAIEAPDIVRSCIMIDSNTASPGPGRNEIVHSGNPHAPGSRASVEWVLRRFSFGEEHLTPELIDAAHAIVTLEKSRHAAHQMRGGLAETVFTPSLYEDRKALFALLGERDIGKPLLLVWAFNDPTAPLAQGFTFFDLLARRQSRCQMHVINRSGHFCHREQPRAFNRVAIEFLEGIGADV